MGFFEEAVVSMKKAGKTVGEKANEAYGRTKKKVELTEVKSKIKAAYTDIGQLVYEGKKSGVDNTVKIEPYIVLIDDLNDQIQSLQDEINELKNISVCSICGAENTADAEFCSKCGAKIAKEQF